MKNHREDTDHGLSVSIRPDEKDLGGFSVRRFLPNKARRKVGPFVFFDHMGPADFGPGEGIDVRPHPHIGLATITYLFEGEIVHRDSLGNVQTITPGAVNWMIAGRGIAHSERTGEERRANGHRLHGIQIWVGLPEESEETEPDFLHVASDDLPVVNVDGAVVRVVIGAAYGVRSPVKTHSPLFLLDVSMPAGTELAIPGDYPERALHVISGEIEVNGGRLKAFDMVVCGESDNTRIKAGGDSRMVLFGGETMTRRYLWWNFVSSSRERIEAAKQDWLNNRFGEIPGETEFIPLPED